MDVANRRTPRSVKGQKSSSKKGKNGNSLKVVYISSPMKVRTSASRFRSLVQELTGENSDISHYMEGNNTFDQFKDFFDVDCGDHRALTTKETGDKFHASPLQSSDNTPTSSGSFLEPIDGAFASAMDDQFVGYFSNSCFSISSEVDVLGSYEQLL